MKIENIIKDEMKKKRIKDCLKILLKCEREKIYIEILMKNWSKLIFIIK